MPSTPSIGVFALQGDVREHLAALTALGADAFTVRRPEELERCEPSLPEAWRPTSAVPDGLAEVLGPWHWGNTPFVLRLESSGLVLENEGETWCRFALGEDAIVGTTGYLAGETLHVVRRDDGSVSHLECATFVLTRTPYGR